MNNYEKLKQRHPLRRDIILIIVLLLLILVAIIFPRFTDLREPAQETEIIYIETKKNTILNDPMMSTPGSESLLQLMHEWSIPPELIPDSFDFEMPVLDTFSLDSLYKYEPRKEGPPPPPLNREKCVMVDVFGPSEPKPIGGAKAIYSNIVYPELAKRAGIEGQVIVQCFIDENGSVQKTVILKGLDFSGMNDAAVNAIKKTKFKPAIWKREPVGVWIAIPVTFKLN